LTKVLWRNRWLIAISTVLITATVAALSVVLPKKYTATVTVAPVSASSSDLGASGISSLLSQMGGLASLAGISVPGGDEKSQNIAILQSEGLTQRFIRTYGLLPALSKRNKQADSLWKADVYFRGKVRQVTTDPKSGLVSLGVTWTDPEQAAQWANAMVRMTNDYIRDNAIAETQRNIAYLNDQASKTDQIGVKQAIYSILQEEIKRQMLAKGSNEYALKVIDPAIAPERATSPRPRLWTAAAFLGSLAAAALCALCWLAWRE
jgi:uncharacterized protein involved in exopolysaccharide biosynthesis